MNSRSAHLDKGTAAMAGTALAALGIVFGDIGTSPLYAMRAIFLSGGGVPISETNVLGVVSLIFWALVLVISIKYVAVVMRADNDGEGGILALLVLVGPKTRAGRRNLIVLMALFGTALLLGDGMITPAISVLSAVEGFQVAVPALDRAVVPVAIAILIGLFSIQSRGTGSVGKVFGPLMLVWFFVIGGLGFAEVVREPSILRAVSPVYAIEFFAHNSGRGFLALGSVFLVVTGGEALYADMGHFGRGPIALSWVAVAFPALLLNYAGQGAALIADPAVIENPFYLVGPEWALIPLAVLATAATVIASQALITGAFSLTAQAIQLGYSPRLRIEHTSDSVAGQVYVPTVNWLLLAACVGLVIGFGSSERLAAAYGVAVTTTMLITTVLLFLVARRRWDWPLWQAGAVAAGFLVFDFAFLGANLLKVVDGGWFPLAVAAMIFTAMTTWSTGKSHVNANLDTIGIPLDEFLRGFVDHPATRVTGTAVYLHRQALTVPPPLLTNLRMSHVLAENVVIVRIVTDERARVPAFGRSRLKALGHGFYSVELRYGFFEQPDVPRELATLKSPGLNLAPESVNYILGVERVIPSEKPGMARWREELFAMMHRNAAPAALYFRIPAESVIEVGREVEI